VYTIQHIVGIKECIGNFKRGCGGEAPPLHVHDSMPYPSLKQFPNSPLIQFLFIEYVEVF